MSSEYVIPRNNEEEFVHVASKLGIKKICFLYDCNNLDPNKIKETDLMNSNKIKITVGIIVNQKNLKKAAKFSGMLIAKSSDEDRFLIESKKIKLIYGFESLQKKDYMHQRGSGINHVLCHIAKQNNVAVGFSYNLLANERQSSIIGRVMQNIFLCQKYKVNAIIASFSDNPYRLKSKHDVLSLFKMLGMNKKIESF